MNVLLTGSSGFVGDHLVAKHDIFRHVVRASDVHFFSNVFIVESINATTNWSNAFEGVDVIIHLAGLAHSAHYSTLHYQNVNVDGTLKLATEARKAGVQRFVFVSSIGVNGTSTQTKPFSVKFEPAPHNDYAQSKYEAELGLKKIAEETGLEVVIVRPTLVYGPNAPGNFGMLTKLVRKLPVLPFGLANNRRDFIAVQNLADLLITCATHPNAAGHTFLASDGETVSIKRFTNAMAKGLGKRVVQLPIPVGLMRLVGKVTGKSAMIEQLFGNLEVDSSNIQKVLGWTSPFTMEQAMASLKDSDK
ncbi:3-beta hydroxysteroid dehydrogenase/isomerase family protein [Vibrio cholerae]|uniref:NAD-dependent epimerase/dehydratase family protein n=1 Tax=Vibrio cholerae TaxID=666 RepID=UPI0011D336BD|nr:NAD-dependent epimerase/dehydratase family protein [Vibrio cholerae]TXY01614.1 NAD-dependent epimerase/dehydratase family protein [Vibrio cholerae]BCN17635.1 putative epimerase [Vibrio cholerae]GIA73299.1 3-beta hydroxysteroid dehydrogenase/isomerase family protein [Vibrio cholerae]